tara:strand:- start:2629 stop:2946 length:318 start_codon:yes stop_codon:yes gene_type:complete
MKHFFLFVFITCMNAFSDFLIFDVRTDEEFSSGHIEDSINIVWQDISKITEMNISKDEEIYLYCRSGNRSGKATKILIELGYTNVINAGSIQSAAEKLNLKIIKD